MKTQSNNSVCQAILALIILVLYFTPWIRISVYGERLFSTSFIEVITNTEKVVRELSGWGAIFFIDIKNYAVLLFIIPLLTIINAIVQWIYKYPIFSFYSVITPIVIGFIIFYFLIKNDEMDMIGIGLTFTLIIGIISAIVSWVDIGDNKIRYRTYILNATAWGVVSVVWWVFLYATFKYKLLNSFHIDIKSLETVICFFLSISFVMVIGTFHLPFLFYVWFIVPDNVVVDTEPEAKVETIPSQPLLQEPVKEENGISCPQCQMEIPATVNFCPYCGCDFKKKVEDKKVENENLRFAPPQYRERD